MMIFNTDLDNTIIYSYKHNIGKDKINVELYKGREISFITRNTWEMLKQLEKKLLMVPTTTRTVEQYNRIDLKIDVPKYALVCNGGVLLVNGNEVSQWYQESLDLVKDSIMELENAIKWLQKDSRRIFEVRFIRELFIFTKCNDPEAAVEDLRQVLNLDYVDVFNNGLKVYVLPKTLNKGQAVKRFKEYMGYGKVIAAGDSEFDISMLNAADIAIAPKILKNHSGLKKNAVFMPENKVFSDELLQYVIKSVIQ